MNNTRETKVKKQKETHSEIERKRRERMKRETEFLSAQLIDKSLRKDKLSIYKAGAEQLINYTETLGKRDFILSDSEYSAIILNNFNGIALHIQCCDGEILWCNEKIRNILGLNEDIIIGSLFQSICEPSYETNQIIETNLSIDESEVQQLKNGELICRNFVVGMKVSDKILSKNHCTRGYDGKYYRFVELCGDISNNTDELYDDLSTSLLFKCIGRPLDLATPIDTQPSFTVKINPDTYHVIEIIGNTLEVLGVKPSNFIDRKIDDYIADDEIGYFNDMLRESYQKECVDIIINLKSNLNEFVEFSVNINSISINSKLLFIIGKFCQLNSSKSEDRRPVLKNEKINCIYEELYKSKDIEETENQTNVMFDLPEYYLEYDKKPQDNVDNNLNEKSESCETLPNNDSFKSLLGDCNDLFQPDSIQDLVSEDINDIKCDIVN